MRLKRSWLFLLILIPVFAMSSCGGGGGGGDSSGYIGGTWTGTWVSTTYAGQGSTLVFSLIQKDTVITGTGIMHDTANGDIEGSVQGNVSVAGGPGEISLVITTSADTQVVFAGTYTANTITGTYSTSGDRGLVNLAK